MERRKLVDIVCIVDNVKEHMPLFVCFWIWRKDTYMYDNDLMRLFEFAQSTDSLFSSKPNISII